MILSGLDRLYLSKSYRKYNSVFLQTRLEINASGTLTSKEGQNQSALTLKGGGKYSLLSELWSVFYLPYSN